MIDPFGRTVTYLRVSVTDRCDLRCVYCMAPEMTFLPKAELLTLEELYRLCGAFIAKGVRQIRLTGGEPLVRRDVARLIARLGSHLGGGGLDELTMTTNGTLLPRFARDLAAAGMRRINVSLDTRDPALFAQITRGGALADVLAGIAAAEAAGLAVKLNVVALKGLNEGEIPDLIRFAHAAGRDITLIEAMPLGEIGALRFDHHLPLSAVRARLEALWTLEPLPDRTGGPARYVRVRETGGRLGFITPLTHNFCESCNRVRLDCTGRLHLCLGQEEAADLRAPLRAGLSDAALSAQIDAAIARKPRGHDFRIERRDARPALARYMSTTGG